MLKIIAFIGLIWAAVLVVRCLICLIRLIRPCFSKGPLFHITEGKPNGFTLRCVMCGATWYDDPLTGWVRSK